MRVEGICAKLLTLALLVGLVPAGAPAQRRAVQTSFGSETPIRRPVPVPRNVSKQIGEAHPDFLRSCGGTLAGSLGASAVDINADGILDLVVQGTDLCTMGAHATNFWVFSKTKTRFGVGYDLVLYAPGDGLGIGRTATNAYRDIETSYYTALEAYSTVWKFDGSKYQPRECFIEDFKTRRRQRTTCNAEE